jgi:uncharacterized protein YbjT (DUF2867 family)
MYAVAGVSGNTGAVVADELIHRGEKVRVIVRSEEKGAAWKAKGAEVAIASLDDAVALAAALKGVDGAYLLLPPDMGNQDMAARGQAFGKVFASAVTESGVKHVVFLSSIGAHLESGNGPIVALRAIEQALEKTGVAATFLRPTFFIENWATSLHPAQGEGVLPSFIEGDVRFPMVATKDIGTAAADALLHPPSGTRIIELAGPEDYTPVEIASAAGEVIGRDVKPAVGPLEAVVPAFTSFGISEHIASLFRDMYASINTGHLTWDGKGERKRGTTTPVEVFRKLLGK